MKRLFIAICAAVASVASAQGPVSTAFTYQGELRSGGNVAAGVFDFRFRIYDAPTAGTQIGSMLCADNVTLAGGRFTAQLDFGAQYNGQQRYLEVDVRADTGLDCSNVSGFTTLAPRQPLSAAPYSAYALTAGTATTATTASNATNATQLNGQSASYYTNAANLTGTLPGGDLSGSYTGAVTLSNASNAFTGSGAGLTSLNAASLSTGTLPDARLSANIPRLNTANAFGAFTNTFMGNVGIGTASPAALLHLKGADEGLRIDGSTSGVANRAFISFRDSAGARTGYVGDASVFDSSVLLEADTGDVALLTSAGRVLNVKPSGNVGIGTSSPAATLHIQTSAEGLRLQGQAAGAANYAYETFYDSAGTRTGWVGDGSSGNNSVYLAADTGNTILGTAFGDSVVVYPSGNVGLGTSSDGGTKLSVQGSTSNSTALYATCNAASGGIAIEGVASGTSGWGVYGGATGANSTGVFGSNNQVNSYALYGYDTAGGSWGCYAQGALGASGTKSFRIDHPADPENKYLLHYCTESPEALNFYSGKVTLDSDGRATVRMPDYFASINKDPRYTLTPMGAAMPMLHIDQEIDEAALTTGNAIEPGEPIPACSFTIAGGAPNARVSWRVEALRNDRYIQRRGAPVETDKPEGEKGLYQIPDLYDQPAERGMHRPAEPPVPRAPQQGR